MKEFISMDPPKLFDLGVRSFFAGFKQDPGHFYHDDQCSRSGPSWAASQIMGTFRRIVSIRQENLCAYVDVIRGKHDRLMIVAEFHSKNLTDISLRSRLSSDQLALFSLSTDIIRGLAFLNRHDLLPLSLTPEMITYDERNNIFKIADFASSNLTGFGSFAPLRPGDARYLAPELLLLGPTAHGAALQAAVVPSSAVWSLGVILCEILQIADFSSLSVAQWVSLILGDALKKKHPSFYESTRDPQATGENSTQTSVIASLDEVLRDCTTYFPSLRPGPVTVLTKFHETVTFSDSPVRSRLYDPLWDVFPPVTLRCRSEVVKTPEVLKVPLASRGIDELYRLWTLAGGDVLGELRAQGFAAEEPAILSLPQLSTGEQTTFAKGHRTSADPSGTLVVLNMKPLLERLDDVAKEVYFPLLLRSDDAIRYLTDYDEMRDLPLVIRENNLKYQLHRQILFHRLFCGYPFTQAMIKKEAAMDVPPLYRARTWAALLGIKGDIVNDYESIDKDSPCSSDRQIEVDIPRCHQYNSLMSSMEAHVKLKRILKAWIADHPQFVYWQGLDSLSAPFVYLNFSDEPLAYACLSAFVTKYVHSFFLKDNTPVIQEYLAVFSHLLAFHDPILATHLSGIGFLPELYSIPWFLTMFTHVFPLHKIFHLWDQLLLGDESFPLFIGLSLLTQLRSQLLSCGFNECILLFSDFPDLDIQQCLNRAKDMFNVTPKCATFRNHARNVSVSKKDSDSEVSPDGDTSASPEGAHVLDLETLKTETCPRITWEEIQWLNNFSRQNGSKRRNGRPLLVDVRTADEFLRGTLAHSINIPFLTAFNADGELLSTFESRTLEEGRGKLVVVFDGKCTMAPKFASELVRLGFPHVTILHHGIDHLKTSGFVSVPSSST
ncbi:TBC domain-containing protein kinase-like protein [Hypsibius exemplaris]|uniref:TBC domain-containing protein kinase-like protein n=1 Tax=Hypsibius exemplaris TaxID=2072580 RepID=A0A1W0WH73_HYPEX|nr:TBC domain-containing protein kinase-like protein [Hypsibius exemplaris]